MRRKLEMRKKSDYREIKERQRIRQANKLFSSPMILQQVLMEQLPRKAEYPSKCLPKNIRKYFIEIANIFFNELTEKKLDIGLVNESGKKKRKVQIENPKRYSDLYCALNGDPKKKSGFTRKQRKSGGTVRRDKIFKILRDIMDSKDKPLIRGRNSESNTVAVYMRHIMAEMLSKGYYQSRDIGYIEPQTEKDENKGGMFFPPIPEVCKFLKIEPLQSFKSGGVEYILKGNEYVENIDTSFCPQGEVCDDVPF